MLDVGTFTFFQIFSSVNFHNAFTTFTLQPEYHRELVQLRVVFIKKLVGAQTISLDLA